MQTGRANEISFLLSRLSWPATAISLVIMMIGEAIRFSARGRYLGITALRVLYWLLLGLALGCYVLLTQSVKLWLLWRKWT